MSTSPDSRVRTRRAGLTAAVVALVSILASSLPVAAASTIVIHTFTGAEGNGNSAALIQATDGFFYGVSSFGGAADPDGLGTAGSGTVFRMDAAGQMTVLHSFDRCDPAGYEPRGALIQGSDGALYGTTAKGGEGNSCTATLDDRRGTVFRMELDGTMSTVHTFVDYHDGDGPWAALVEGPDGALYGTTRTGGDIQQAWPLGRGTIFRVTKGGDFTVLRRFTGPDGLNPIAPLMLASDGKMYGTTPQARSTDPNESGSGTIFRITTGGAFTQLKLFGFQEGAEPRGRLVQHPADGYLYGVTRLGGPYQDGVVYRIHPSGTGFQVLHRFGFDGGYASTGSEPADGLVIADDGSFYGTTQFGGQPVNDPDTTDEFGRNGTIFRMKRSGKLGVMHTFMGGDGGLQPQVALVQSANGKLFGMAWGGAADRGIAYRYAPNARPVLKDVGANPTEVWAGDPAFGVSTGTVILDGRAPVGGTVVSLTSSRPNLLQVPPSVKVKAGWSTEDFPITTSSSAVERTVTITATYGGISRTVVMTVHPSF